jgi:hypothetical protein
MPADFSEYINLEVFNKEPGDIYRDSVELARISLPEFNLRIGTPEDAIFQAMAYVSALNIATINRIPDRLMAGLVSILGFQRQDSIPAEMNVVVTLSSYDGGTIPAGTVFSYEALFEDEVQQFAFQTTEAVEVPETDFDISSDYPSVTVPVTCLQPGVIPPIGEGVELSIVSSGTDIFSVITASPTSFANGINEDLDGEYLSKATTYLRSLSSSLTTASQMDAYLISAYPGVVTRAKTYDLTNGDDASGDISVTRNAGIVNTYLVDNLATIQTNAPHLFVTGDVVDIQIFNNAASATFNGEYEITGTGDTTFSYARVASNSGSTTVSGSAYAGQDVSGYVSVFVYGANNLVDTLQKADILEDIRNKSVAGLSFEILDPDLLLLTIDGEITISSQYNAEAVQTAIENALLEYISPENFPYTQDRIRTSQLISIISAIPGVVYVQSLSMTPVGPGWLPRQSVTGSFGPDMLFLNKGALPIIGLDDLNITYSVSDTGYL